MVCKLAFSILLQFLFVAVGNDEKSLAYIYAFFSTFVWFIGQVSRHNAFYQSPILGNRIRSGMILILFAKISKLSQYIVKSSELGKITNLLSNDFNTIEQKIPIFFAAAIFPFAFIGIAVIVIIRLGWAGAIGVFALPILSFPIMIFISKKNGELLQRVNVNKDKRVQTCT
jgi:ATP-binding cassette subfamily C (CFTR/MRP) protein 4